MSDDPPSPLLEDARYLAASVGAFAPATLAEALSEGTNARSALLAVSGDCVERIINGAPRWMLKPDARRMLLDKLQKEIGLDLTRLATLFNRLPLAPEDDYGRYLRQALQGEAGAEPVEDRLKETYYEALEFVGRAQLGAAPAEIAAQATSVRYAAAGRAFADALEETIGPAFVGRTKQLRRLNAFAAAAPTTTSMRDVPLLSVTGIGGSGKSALVARFVQQLREDEAHVAIVVLDFDRPSLVALDPGALTSELLRQLIVSRPDLEPALSSVRRDLSDQSGAEGVSKSSFERGASQVFAAMSAMANVPGLAALDVLVILDTFEQVVMRGTEFETVVFDWLRDLRDVAHLFSLRAIASGRATPSSPGRARSRAKVTMRLGDLPSAEARRVLRLRGIPAGDAAKLCDVFGGNPLVLHLIGNVYEADGVDAVRALTTSADARGAFTAEAAQRILYSRILGRIKNPVARQLASPGLVVRCVTPGVIQYVIAPVCRLNSVDRARSVELFEALAAQVWLVTREQARVIVHRPDLRRLMLPLIGARTEDGVTVSPIDLHQAARDYFAQRLDLDLDPARQAQEALYHDLFLSPGRVRTDAVALAFAVALGGALAEMPTLVRAIAKLRTNRPLTAEEEAALDDDEHAAYQEMRSARRLRSGVSDAYAKVAPLPSVSVDDPPQARVRVTAPFANAKGGIDAAEVALAFAQGRFEEIVAAGDRIHTDFQASVHAKDVRRHLQNLTESPAWLFACAALVAPPPDAVTDLWRGTRFDLREPDLRRTWLDQESRLTGAHVLTALGIVLRFLRRTTRASSALGLEGEGLSAWITYIGVAAEDPLVREPVVLRTTHAVRVFQLLAIGDPGAIEIQPPSMLLGLARYLSPNVFPSLWPKRSRGHADVAPFFSTRNPRLQRALEELTTASSRERTLEIWNAVDKSLSGEFMELSGPGEAVLQATQGITPELHPPLRAALTRACATERTRNAVVEAMRLNVPFWPTTLDARGGSDGWSAAMIQCADRAGVLHILVEEAENFDFDPKVGALYRAYETLLKAPDRRGETPPREMLSS